MKLHELANPALMARQQPEWMADHFPDYMAGQRTEWMCEHSPGFMLERYSSVMFEHRPLLMVERASVWGARTHPLFMLENYPMYMKENFPAYAELFANSIAETLPLPVVVENNAVLPVASENDTPDLEQLAAVSPLWVAENYPHYMVMHHALYMLENYKNWMLKNYPLLMEEYAARNTEPQLRRPGTAIIKTQPRTISDVTSGNGIKVDAWGNLVYPKL
jgi:hypothetical protein